MSTAKDAGIVWMDGKFVENGASVSVMALTMHYGLGAFEGIRSYEGAQGPAVFRLREHVERLFRSAKLLRMDMHFSVEDVMKACTETLAKNGLKAGYIRPLVYADDGQRGLAAINPTRIAVVVWPWGAYLGEEGLTKGIRTMISGWARMNAKSFLPKGKICGQYVNSILAKRDAIKAGYDEALMLDDNGFIAEGTGENIFVVKNGQISTPPLSAPILEGITRDSVIQIAKTQDFDVIERNLLRSDLFDADEIFLTGTAAEVTPVREIDGREIGIGSRGPITEQIQSAYFRAVRGEDFLEKEWLSPYSV